jgi:phosphonate transport system substrate-binding protein
MKKQLLIILAAGSLMTGAAFADEWRKTYKSITFGISSGENQQSGNLRWAPMGPYLAKCMGIEKVTMRVTNDYSGIIEAMVQGDVQLAWLGPAQYAVANDLMKGDVHPVGMDMSKDGELGYKWVVVVKASSPYKTLADLKGKSMGWPTPTSASGYVLPMHYFRQMGYVSQKNEPVHFSKLVQTGSHDNSLVSVVNGTVDAATNWYYSPKAGAHIRAAGVGTIKLEDIRFIHESPMVPNAPFTTRKSYPAEMKAKMSDCLLNMPKYDAAAWATVGKDIFGGIAPTTHEAYADFIALRQAEMKK